MLNFGFGPLTAWLAKSLKKWCRSRTPDPIITNDVLYKLSYSGFSDLTMALLVLFLCRELFGFASHSRGDLQNTKYVFYRKIQELHFLPQRDLVLCSNCTHGT